MPAQSPVLRRFGDNIRAQREAKALSQEQLAELADLDRTYISGVERGVRNLSLLSAVRIAKALKTTVADLSGGIER
jgi:transcriptional regulator with XRE-family HTH domain